MLPMVDSSPGMYFLSIRPALVEFRFAPGFLFPETIPLHWIFLVLVKRLF